MKFPAKNSQKGFSLAELVIYVALLALFSVAMVNTLLILTKSWTTVKLAKSISISATSVLERMTREVRTATAIDTGLSTFNATSSVLVINSQDLSGAATTFKFFVSGSTLKIQKGAGSSDALTLSTTPVTNFTLRRITTSQSEAVRIELQVQSTYRGQTSTQDFYDVVQLRGGYQN